MQTGALMCITKGNPAVAGVRYGVYLWRSYYSNVSRGKRHKENQDGLIPCILEPEENSQEYQKNWARDSQAQPCEDDLYTDPDLAKNEATPNTFHHGKDIPPCP